jgi:hypothetical protein
MKAILRWALAAVAVAAMAGCSGEAVSPTSTGDLSGSAAIDAEVAQAAVETAGETVQSMNPGGAPRAFRLRFPARIPEGCDFDAASGRFVCEPFEGPNGAVIERSYAFLDAAGAPQSAYDAALTASIDFQCEVSGEFERGPASGTVAHERHLVASGLAGDETTWTWNGEGAGQVHREGPPPMMGRGGGPGNGQGNGNGRGNGNGPGHGNGPGNGNAPDGPVILDIVSDFEVNDVVVPYPPAEGSYPLSGSIEMNMTTTITGGPHDGEVREHHVVITFNGTQYATITVGDEVRQIDLANPPAPPHRKRQNS